MDFSMIGVEYDKSQTFRRGAAKAPKLIRSMFPKLETYVSGVDLEEHFVEDLGDVSDPKDVSRISSSKGFPIILGGDHRISFEAVRAVKPKTFVSFDAHPDCEDTDGHTGVTRRILESGVDVKLFGVRIASKKEGEFMRKKKIKVSSLKDLKKLKKVYLSIDVDVLDPSIISNVGNPEPDGLKFKEVMDAVKVLAPNLVAVDIVEYTPGHNDDVQVHLVAKLIYSIMAEVIKARK